MAAKEEKHKSGDFKAKKEKEKIEDWNELEIMILKSLALA